MMPSIPENIMVNIADNNMDNGLMDEDEWDQSIAEALQRSLDD